MKKYLLLFFLFMQIVVVRDFAQTNNQSLSSLSGTIKEIYTNEPLPGARVIIKDTELKTSADYYGNYLLINIKPGIYSIEVEMIGYNKFIMDSIQIDSAKSYNFDFVLIDYWECYKYVDSANNDIRNNTVRYLLHGFIISTYGNKIPEYEIREITRKFGFEYEQVDVPCTELYNKIIEQYLIERNGKDWKERFNEDIKMLKQSYFIN